jgi:sugar transferase (PEP-CTERM/EpsH1 system associated)
MSDPQQRRRLGEAGRRYVLANHSWDFTALQMEDLYRQTATRRVRSQAPTTSMKVVGSTRRYKVLIVSSEVPYPPTHGGARLKLYELMKYLSQRHELTLLSLAESPDDRKYAEALKPYCHAIEVFDLPNPIRPATWRDYLRAPYWRLYYSAEMARAVRRHTEQTHYDLVHMDTGFMAMYGEAVQDTPKMLVATDCLTALRFSIARNSEDLSHRVQQIWWALMVLNYERQLYPQYLGCVVVAQPDADELRRMCPQLPLWVIPNGVDIGFFQPNHEIEQPNQLVFTGTMDYGPNVDAVVHFVHNIFPVIRRQAPDVQFSIVGRSPSAAVQELAHVAGVTVTGFLPDLRQHVQRATVYVCPLRQGAGMKNKMLEAMAMSKAIVATHSAASGLAVADGRELLLREGDEAFAKTVIELMRDERRRRQLGEAARQYVMASHSWEYAARLLDDAYAKTVALASVKSASPARGE